MYFAGGEGGWRTVELFSSNLLNEAMLRIFAIRETMFTTMKLRLLFAALLELVLFERGIR